MKKIIFIILILLGNVSLQQIAAKSTATHRTKTTNNKRFTDIILDYRKTDTNITGDILDKKTKEHLSFINISLKGTTIGTQTDRTGHFFLRNLPLGTYTVQISSVGYKPISRTFHLEKGKTINVRFEIEEDLVALEGVVVSANRNETLKRFAPSLVSVVGLKTFEMTNSPSLADGLSFQPGVRVEDDCQNCGFSQVRINGLAGPYTQILMDSRPMFSALTGVYGLEQIPVSMIERVEVMRGGSSALFGSSAIAGTINIITKTPEHNSADLSHTISNINGSGAFDNTTILNLSLVTDDHKAGVFIFGQSRERSGYDFDRDGYTEIPKINTQTLGLHSFYKISDYSKLTAEYHHIGEFRRGGNKLQLPAHMADLCEQIQHSINGGSLNVDIYSPSQKYKSSIYASAQNTNRDSYYGGYGHTDDLTSLVGTQLAYNSDNFLFMPATWTMGAEYNYEGLKDYSFNEKINPNDFYKPTINQTTNTASAFVQNEWKNKTWSFLIGARIDKHNLINHTIFSPRINIRYNPKEHINIRLTYAEGFRAPQAFDEDLHIGNVGEQLSIIKLDPKLKEEKSKSYSLSTDIYQRFGNWQGNFTADAFCTILKDPFVLQETSRTETTLIKTRTNGSGAKVWGVNLEGKMAYRSLFELQAGATLERSFYDESENWSEDESLAARKMTRTPDVYGYFTAIYTPTKPLNIAFNGTYIGHMIIPHASISSTTVDKNITSPDFFEFGTKISYDFQIRTSLKLQINVGINNMFNAYQKDFDKGKDRDSAYIYGPSTPRSYFAGIKISY
ncbi:MAG: TonB-dependent receptor [Bacteroidaceae bacterium]